MKNLPRGALLSRSARLHAGIAGRSRLRAAALGLCAAGLIAACATPRTPEATGYKVAFEVFHKGSALPAVQPADVTIYDSTDVVPTGVRFERGVAVVAVDFPSPDQPHRDVGKIVLHEIMGYSPGEDWTELWDEPQFVAKRNDLLKKAAAKHGANAVFLTESPPLSSRTRRHKVYYAVSLSTSPPVYPSVDEVLDALHLAKEGYHEAHRFTARLADLGARKPEPVRLEAGHEYMFAMVLHPDLVSLGLDAHVSLGFFLNVERDILHNDERPGRFSSRLDKPYDASAFISSVDGVFARGGAGTMGVDSRLSRVELVSRPAKLRFSLFAESKGPQPIEHLGAGEADFIVFERAAPREQFVKEVCDFCVNSARSCPKRQPLDTCEALRACFKQVEQPSSICSTRYQDI